MITAIISLVIGFSIGFYAGLKNFGSAKVAKAKSIFEELKK